MSEDTSFEFDFTVSGITARQADKLLDAIISMVEAFDAQMAGGVSPVKDDDDVKPDGSALGSNGQEAR